MESIDLADLAALWRGILPAAEIAAASNFFASGGHAMHAMEMIMALRSAKGIDVPLSCLYDHPTLAAFHAYVAGNPERLQPHAALPSTVVRLNPGPGAVAPTQIFCLHSGRFFRTLARRLDDRAVLYALTTAAMLDFVSQRSEAMPASIAAVARDSVAVLRTMQPRGPYFLLGYSFGGRIAFECAQQLRAVGEDVAVLAIFDTALAGTQRRRTAPWLWMHAKGVAKGGLGYLRHAWQLRQERQGDLHPPDHIDSIERQIQREACLRNILRPAHQPSPYDGPALLFQARQPPPGYIDEPGLGWKRIMRDNLEIHLVDGDHDTMLSAPHVDRIATVLRQKLDAAQR